MSTQPAERPTGPGARPALLARGWGAPRRPPAPVERLWGVVARLRVRPSDPPAPQRCDSWAPVAYLDGLTVQDVHRWSSRCDLLAGHTGHHRSASDTWS
jgi:hypothetical protein